MEQTRALYANRDRCSYIPIAFIKLHLEKNIQIIEFKKLYRSTDNYVRGITFAELKRITFREQHIDGIKFRELPLQKILRTTFTESHSEHYY